MVDTRSARPTALPDILETDGEALSLPRSANCWKAQSQLSPSCVRLLPKESNMMSEGSNWSPVNPCIQLHSGNCLHLHSLPKSFPSLSRAGAADARHWSRKPAAVSITSWLYEPSQAASPFPPLPHLQRKALSLGLGHPPVCHCADPIIYLFILFVWGDQIPTDLVPLGRGLGSRGAMRAPGLWGRALLAARDPFMALSAVNLSALQDAITSFFICSSFSSDNVPLRQNSNLLPISCKMWLKFPHYDCCFTYTHTSRNKLMPFNICYLFIYLLSPWIYSKRKSSLLLGTTSRDHSSPFSPLLCGPY